LSIKAALGQLSPCDLSIALKTCRGKAAIALRQVPGAFASGQRGVFVVVVGVVVVVVVAVNLFPGRCQA